MKTIHETGEILIFTDINGLIPHFACNGWPVAINGPLLQLLVLEQKQQEVCYGLYRGGGELKSTWLLWHQMVHFASQTDLVETLWGSSVCVATASENSCSVISEAIGARHGDSGLTDSFEGSDGMVEAAGWAGWAGTKGSGSTRPLHPKTKAWNMHALRVPCFLEHQVRILHSRAHRGPDFIPPPYIYRQLSVAMSTLWFKQRSRNCFRARKTAFSSR